jgi:hypothetical protein
MDGDSLMRPVRFLYVATDLEAWETERPETWARDVTISGKAFRRLDAEYFAWLADRMERARAACGARRITGDAMIRLERCWRRIQDFAEEWLGSSNQPSPPVPLGYVPPRPPKELHFLPARRDDERGAPELAPANERPEILRATTGMRRGATRRRRSRRS